MPIAGKTFTGEIILVAFNFAPPGFAACNGQTLPINQNQALFSLLGTQFGGNGQTTFALPDLRGRVPVGAGAGDFGTVYQLGGKDGVEAVTLTPQQMASHTHAVDASGLTVSAACQNGAANRRGPVANVFAEEVAAVTATYSSAAPNAAMNAAAIATGGAVVAGNTGGNQSHSNVQPTVAIGFCICIQGLFPSRV